MSSKADLLDRPITYITTGLHARGQPRRIHIRYGEPNPYTGSVQALCGVDLSRPVVTLSDPNHSERSMCPRCVTAAPDDA